MDSSDDGSEVPFLPTSLIRTVSPPPEYTERITTPNSALQTPQTPFFSFSLTETIDDSRPLPPLPSPIYSPSLPPSPFFPTTPSSPNNRYFPSPYSPYSPYGTPSPTSHAAFQPFMVENPPSYHQLQSASKPLFFPSPEELRRKKLDESESFRLRRARNTRLIGVIACVALLLVALAIGLAVVGVVMGWDQGKGCVRWDDGSHSGNCDKR